MKKYPFICKNCGSKYLLQSWKAVCPSCGAEYTLEQVSEKPLPKSSFPQLLAGLSVIAYVAYGFFAPSLFSAFGFPPQALLQAIGIFVALLSAAGSTPFIAASLMMGVAALFLHATIVPSIVGLPLGLSITCFCLIAIYRLLKHSKRKVHEVDARSMPEYSGWGGPRQDD